MKVHIVVSTYGGVLHSVGAYMDKGKAKEAERESKKELGIVEGAEEESEHSVALVEDVRVFE